MDVVGGGGGGGGGRGRGFRVLAIDGGGTRALLALQVLKRIEESTGVPLRESFDVIAGTSSGGVLAVAVGLLGKSLDECEKLYIKFAKDVLTRRPSRAGTGSAGGLYHAGRLLLLNKGMYDTNALRQLYEEQCGPGRLFEHAAGAGTPRVFVLSTQMRSHESGVRTPRAYLHANYRVQGGRYAHGCLHRLSEALRATTAAPVYFDPFVDELGELFCDGGVVMNNPASVAVHEARCLWPGRAQGVVVSVGTGLFTGAEKAPGVEEAVRAAAEAAPRGRRKPRDGSMAMRVAQAVLGSATDTEGVHHALEDLIADDSVYFRLNPDVKGEYVHLDEYRVEVLQRLRDAGTKYATEGAGAARIDALCRKLKALSKQSGQAYGGWRAKGPRSYARL